MQTPPPSFESHHAVLTRDEIRDVNAPIETARTLPPRAFNDEVIFETERRQLFAAGWIALAFEADVPRSGSALPIDALGTPLLVVRQQDGSLIVLHNLCPYDACPVLLEHQSSGVDLVAAYHGWRFDLAGHLQAAPYWNGHFDSTADDVRLERKDLIQVRAASWRGVVFVNLSGTAQPFEYYIRPLQDRILGLREEALLAPEGVSDSIDTAANWKTLFENACINVYHEGFVHRLYKAASDVPRVDEHGQKTFEEVCDNGLYGLGFSDVAAVAAYGDSGLPTLPWEDQEGSPGCLIVSLYPNLHFTLMRDHIALTIALPVGPQVTRSRTLTLFAQEGCNEEHEMTRLLIMQALVATGKEDSRICEAIQSGRGSLFAEPSPYCPFWDRMHHDFTQRVARAYSASPSINAD